MNISNTYTVTGMTCNGCKGTVERKLNEISGVKATVDLKEAKAIVSSETALSIETLQNALPEKYVISPFKASIFNAEQKASEWKQLFPLYLIFTYITIAALLIHRNLFDLNEFMLDFMGLFYIVFSFFKILDLKGFPKSFRMYDPLAKAVPFYGKIYPFIEVLLGVFFLMRFQILYALWATVIILGITTIGVTQTLINKRKIQCACLGTALKLPMTKATFIENAIMLLMAGWMLLS